MTRRDFLKALGAGTAVVSLAGGAYAGSPASSRRRPNIVLIMADDVGCEVLGSYGGESYNTPNLDRLAATGIRFTHCYSQPVCAPTRVKIMTGRYNFRNYERWGHIPPEEITFGHILQSSGYSTAIAGKWQMTLLKNDPCHVTRMGFQQNCCFAWHEGPRYYGPYIYENGEVKEEYKDDYGPDVYCGFLTDFIRRNKDRPFLAYYSMALAHAISNDLDPPPPTGPQGRYKTYKELVEYMDKMVGRIVKTLEELNLRENTLVLFTGDNGTPPSFITRVVDGRYISEPLKSKVNGKMVKGGKGKLTDSATNVPLIANWPGTAPAGTVCNDLIDFSDFMPTFAELSGARVPQDRVIDGRSFAAQVKGKKGEPRKWAYVGRGGRAWIRTQRWKLYNDGRFFDMKNDPKEKSAIPSGEESAEASKARKFLQEQLEQLRKEQSS